MPDMLFSNLKKHEIFPIPLGKECGVKRKCYLLYAPLSNNAIVVDVDNCSLMEERLGESVVIDENKDEIDEILACLMDYVPLSERLECPQSPDDLLELTILPNYYCNFHCTYCYAAKAHKKTTMSLKMLKDIFFYFLSSQRNDSSDLSVQIIGGGEPVLAWEMLVNGIEYARLLEKENEKQLTISLATNGSILNEQILNDIKRLGIQLSFSFEILPQIQNVQRGQYDKVALNLKKLCEAGLADRITVRSIITPASVDLMGEMVEELHLTFPFLRSVIMEPVMGEELFGTLDNYRNFYEFFFEGLFHARAIGKNYGILVDTTVLRNIDYTVTRACAGDLCLTPDGEFTICHRIASPQDLNYKKVVYGYMNNGTPYFDLAKFKRLIGDNVYKKEQCRNCFAKYNCGGGCLARMMNEKDNWREVSCDFTRKTIQRILLERIDDLYRKEFGQGVIEFINR